VSTLVQARELGSVGFGKYGAVLTTLGLFSVVAQASLGAAASTLIAHSGAKSGKARNEVSQAIIRLLLLFSVTGVLFLNLVAPSVADRIYKAPDLVIDFRIGSLALAVVAFQSVIDGFLAANRLFSERNRLPIIQSATFLLLAASLTGLLGVPGAVLAYAGGAVVASAYGSFVLARVEVPFWPQFEGPEIKIYVMVIKFLTPLVANNIVVLAASWWISVWIARGVAGFGDLGAYTLAVQMRLLVLTAPFFIQSTFSPILSHCSGDNDVAGLQATFESCARMSIGLSVIFGGAVIIGMPILSYILGHAFNDSTALVAVGSLVAFLMAVSNLLGTLLVATRRQATTVLPNLIYMVLIVGGVPLIASRYGGMGAMSALALAQGVQLVMLNQRSRVLQLGVPVLAPTFGGLVLLGLIGLSESQNNLTLHVVAAAVFLFSAILALANMPEDFPIAGFLPLYARKRLASLRTSVGRIPPTEHVSIVTGAIDGVGVDLPNIP